MLNHKVAGKGTLIVFLHGFLEKHGDVEKHFQQNYRF